MTIFWLILGAMVVLALVAVLAPLWWYRTDSDVSQDSINANIFRERLADLDNEFKEQRIDETQFAALTAELERTLLSDVALTSKRGNSGRIPLLIGSLAAIVAPLLALGYYYTEAYRGASEDWLILQNQMASAVELALQQPGQLPPQALEDLPNFTLALQSQVLREGMDDPDSLALLGTSFMQLGVIEQAQSIMQRAFQLAPERSDIALGTAQASLLANDGKLTPFSAQLLQQILRAEPEHQGALMMLGFGAFNGGDYGLATEVWQALLSGLESHSESAQLLRNSIARAEQLAQQAQVTENEGNEDKAAPQIAVTVDLAPELRDKLMPEDILFIFAKAISGPPMPLAAIRQSATGFPVRVVLDDSRAMLPSMKLSNFEQVIVGARISKAGDVSAKPGDLEGLSGPLDLADSPLSVSLTVDQVIQ